MDQFRTIPEPTLRRLPRYHQYLSGLAQKAVRSVSCSQIGAELGLDPTQVRKDLASTQVIGKPNVGHGVPEMLRAIEELLG
jgi:redox-sensing transcriptional repressor